MNGNEIDVLLFGCAVTFVALSGAYVILRERFLEPRPQPVAAAQRRARRARVRA